MVGSERGGPPGSGPVAGRDAPSTGSGFLHYIWAAWWWLVVCQSPNPRFATGWGTLMRFTLSWALAREASVVGRVGRVRGHSSAHPGGGAWGTWSRGLAAMRPAPLATVVRPPGDETAGLPLRVRPSTGLRTAQLGEDVSSSRVVYSQNPVKNQRNHAASKNKARMRDQRACGLACGSVRDLVLLFDHLAR